MTYQAKRRKKVIEEFELVNENGCIVETLHVELNADSMIEKLRRKHLAVIKTFQELNEIQAGSDKPEIVQGAYNTLGIAIADMIEAVFGKEDTEKIIAFYENNYVEMTQEVIPFISEVVIPKVEMIAKENKKEALSRYNRKQRRVFAKGKK